MIRPMTAADKPAVMDLIRATGFFRTDEIVVAEELIDTYLEEPDQKDYGIVVAEDEAKRVAGYMTYGQTPLTAGTYDLYWMAVDPRAQGRGHGRALVEWLEAYVRAAGGRLIIIETSSVPMYEPTRRFYLGLNYIETARIPDFYQPGDDRVIYRKVI
ncbi:MAG: GNAT family N-acetyltransferase, partial [Acidobacteriota bacterium]|nr:GNAT family N-acetyltransferase [Acidobacteriota bacterium]